MDWAAPAAAAWPPESRRWSIPASLASTEQPAGVDRGFLWGLNSYWRYEAVHGGVVVELESLTLSRSVPWGVGAVVGPLVDQVARESMTRTLVSLRERFAEGCGGES